MPGENLTRIEAQGRKAIVDVASYEVVLDLTTGDKTFASTTTVTFSATSGSSTFIDAITAKVHSITLNGTSLDPAAVSDGVRIQLDNLATENVLVVVADAAYTNTGEGLHRFVDPVDGEVYLYSQFEVPDSRRVFAVFEQPDLKATFQFTVTAPAEWEVVSNQPAPIPELVEGGKAKTWKFAATPILSSYVTALIAGPYAVVRDSLTSRDGRTIPLGIYSRKSLTEFVDSDYIFDITRKGF
ncbi:MAG TPA: aminopeptidase N, partial [Galbitalea sp.]|nr:aminopeptidase N [Galbitalea sp.]